MFFCCEVISYCRIVVKVLSSQDTEYQTKLALKRYGRVCNDLPRVPCRLFRMSMYKVLQVL